MPNDVFVAGVGAALPGLRLPRAEIATAWGDAPGKGEVPVCAEDEDVLTLSWQAAGRALEAAGRSAAEVDALVWGTSRPPFAEGPSHALLAAAVGLPRQSDGYLLAGSAHSGIEALLAGWDLLAAGFARTVLVVTADDPRPGLGTSLEREAGAGAAAAVLTTGAGPARLTGRVARTDPVLDRYRGALELATRDVYDARLYREEVFLPAVTEIGTAVGPVDAWSLPAPDARLGAAAAKWLGAAPPTAGIGHAGAAAPLLGAIDIFASPGAVGLLGHGGGRTSAVSVEVTEPVPGAGVLGQLVAAGRATSYAAVLRSRGQLVAAGEPVPMGVPPGSAQFVRGGREILQLLGAKCVECGTVSTPPSIHPRCISCGSDKSTEVPLAREGTVQTFAVNHMMPPPFVAPLPLAVIDLDDGARLMLQMTGGTQPEVGSRVRLVLRRYAVERGAPVYGYKAEES